MTDRERIEREAYAEYERIASAALADYLARAEPAYIEWKRLTKSAYDDYRLKVRDMHCGARTPRAAIADAAARYKALSEGRRS